MIPRNLIRQEPERHEPVQAGVLGLVDHTHPRMAASVAGEMVLNPSEPFVDSGVP